MIFNKDTKLLIVAAHPDDEVLGCGATIAKAIDSGATVEVLFLGEGVSARFDIGDYNSPEFHSQTKIRTEGANKALASLGIKKYSFSTRLCCQFDSSPILVIVKEIEAYINSFKPNMIFTHNPSEVNIDHKIAYEAVEIACRPTSSVCPEEIYTFEIPCSGSWTFESKFAPNIFVNVEKYWKQKIDAWNCYQGEARPFPFPRSEPGLETVAKYRGLSSNLPMVEAFKLVRKIIK